MKKLDWCRAIIITCFPCKPYITCLFSMKNGMNKKCVFLEKNVSSTENQENVNIFFLLGIKSLNQLCLCLTYLPWMEINDQPMAW
jgi:hypothetical protein